MLNFASRLRGRKILLHRTVSNPWNVAKAAPVQDPFLAQRPAEPIAQNQVPLVRSFFHKGPTLIAMALFLLILSGPPRFRGRDPQASLRGDIDWVVVLHVVVWGLAGVWVLLQIGKRFQAGRLRLRLSLPQILGLAMILCLAVSIMVSIAPALTAFKVYQMLVSMFFTQLFVERFGVRSSLNAMLWGNLLLCIAVTVCAFLFPDLVWTSSDFNPDPSRLAGALIASTGVVSVLAIILLLTTVRKIWRPLPLAFLVLLFGLLVLSLMRTAYIVALLFFILVLLKRPSIKPLRQFAYCLSLLLLILYAVHRLPSLSQYRSPETISTLSDRIGLWRHLTAITVHESPWLGLGYYSASRIYGPEFNPGLGTAHSVFLEILLGGGMLSFVPFIALCGLLSAYAGCLLFKNKDRLSFAITLLFSATLIFGSLGEEIDSGPVAICFWYSVAVLPQLYRRYSSRDTYAGQSHRPLLLTAESSMKPETP